MTPLQKLGIGSALQASQLISTLEGITEILAKAIAGDDTCFTTQAAAWDISTETATASAQLANITKTLRNPPTSPSVPNHS